MMADEQKSIDPSKSMELEIRCAVDTAILPMLRTVVTSLANQMEFSQEHVEQIEMAVDEACANVMRHAYRHLETSGTHDPSSPPPILDRENCALWLRLQMGADHLKITVIDKGIGIHCMPEGHDSIQEYTENGAKGGLGIFIIRNFMDEVDYHSPDESGTVLTMVKYRNSAAESGS